MEVSHNYYLLMSNPTICPPDPAQRSFAPCPAVTAVMRNPVYTAWSHEVQANNPPPAPSSSSHPHTHTRCSVSLFDMHESNSSSRAFLLL